MHAPSGTAASKASYSTAAHLILYGLAVTIPLLFLLGVLLIRSASLERQQLEQRILQLLGDLTDDLDRELGNHVTLLQTLATSPAMEQNDWPAFYAHAKAALRGRYYVVLVDRSGRQIVNTYVPYGEEPGRTGDPETLQRFLESPGPIIISNLFVSLVVKKPVLNVTIPVQREGRAGMALSLGLLPDDILSIVHGQKLGADWVRTIADREGTILARSRDQDQYVGQKLPPRLRAVNGEPAVHRVTNIDGQDVLRATTRSPISGWEIAVNVPVTLAEEQIHASIWLWGATTVLIIITAILLGFLFGRTITGPLSAATAAAGALGRGLSITKLNSRLTEANQFCEALSSAQAELEQRTAELRHSEEQLRTAAEAAQFGAYDVDVPNNCVFWSPQLMRILGTDNVGDKITIETVISFIHPDDSERMKLSLQRLLEGRQDVYEFEFRIRRGDGEIRWVMDRGQAVKDAASKKVVRIVGVLIDISKLKSAEQRQELLLNELDHRVKNTLAIVQSIALQTMRTRPEPKEFSQAFSSRLSSLANAHNLLTQGAWHGATLTDTLMAALAPFGDVVRQVTIFGPPITLSPNIVVTVTLMLHELVTNAVKYGALSDPAGKVHASWATSDDPRGVIVSFRWSEIDGPPVHKPSAEGFGSRLLRTSIAQLRGKIDLEYPPDGLKCHIQFVVAAASTEGDGV
jgi:PAS domain S-box-containing protein